MDFICVTDLKDEQIVYLNTHYIIRIDPCFALLNEDKPEERLKASIITYTDGKIVTRETPEEIMQWLGE